MDAKLLARSIPAISLFSYSITWSTDDEEDLRGSGLRVELFGTPEDDLIKR
jgi:hypothetical protein